MSEEEIRSIVRDEVDRYAEECRVAAQAANDQANARSRDFQEEWKKRSVVQPDDGPVVRQVKEILGAAITSRERRV